MLLFADTARVDDLIKLKEAGLLDGVTTNPSLILKAGGSMTKVIAEICRLSQGPVSAEVVASEAPDMVREAEVLAGIAENVCIKLPLTTEGLKACRLIRTSMHREVNITLCFSVGQALLAARAGASYVSPFVGRLDDHGQDGLKLIADIRKLYDSHGFFTKILAASVRSAAHVSGAAVAGADVVTAPPATLLELVEHPLTRAGLEQFTRDWQKTGQSIV